MAITHNNLVSTVIGNKRFKFVETTFDSSYPTGGESITAADFDLTSIDAVVVLGASGVAAAGRFFQWDRANSKLLAYNPVTAHTHTAPAFTGGGTHTHVENTAGAYAQNAVTAAGTETGTVAAIAAATAGAATEVPNTTNLSTVVVHLLVLGN